MRRGSYSSILLSSLRISPHVGCALILYSYGRRHITHSDSGARPGVACGGGRRGRNTRDIPTEPIAKVDGDAGILLIEPDPDTVASCQLAQEKNRTLLIEARKLAHEPATTKDGHTVDSFFPSNVELARAALEDGAEGVGLLRSEFVYLERQSLPDEEEQLRAYRLSSMFLAICR